MDIFHLNTGGWKPQLMYNIIHNKQHVCRYNNTIVLLFFRPEIVKSIRSPAVTIKISSNAILGNIYIYIYRIFAFLFIGLIHILGVLCIIILTFDLCRYRTAGAHVTTTFTSSNNLGLVITGLTEADVGTYTCTATYSNSEYLVRSVIVDSFCKSSKLIA